MAELNHTIVPSHDKIKSSEFFARIFGLVCGEPLGHFAPVRLNDSLTFDFDNREDFERHHYAFKVSEEEFDEIFGRVRAEGIVYGSSPFSLEDGQTNNWGGGRGVYFRDLDGHVLELLTVDITR